MWPGIRKPGELMYREWKWKQIIRFGTDGAKHTKIYGFGTERVKIAIGGDYLLLFLFLNFYCCAVHFDNTKIIFTNKCTPLLHI
jgi:hypothetical protein